MLLQRHCKWTRIKWTVLNLLFILSLFPVCVVVSYDIRGERWRPHAGPPTHPRERGSIQKPHWGADEPDRATLPCQPLWGAECGTAAEVDGLNSLFVRYGKVIIINPLIWYFKHLNGGIYTKCHNDHIYLFNSMCAKSNTNMRKIIETLFKFSDTLFCVFKHAYGFWCLYFS